MYRLIPNVPTYSNVSYRLIPMYRLIAMYHTVLFQCTDTRVTAGHVPRMAVADHTENSPAQRAVNIQVLVPSQNGKPVP